MNGKVEVTRRNLRKIEYSFMVHARVSEAYITFILMYAADHIFLVLPIKDLINKAGNPAASFKLATGTKPPVSHLCRLFPCAVRKATAHFGTKSLNTINQAQKGFQGILVIIPQHQKGYLVYVPHTRKILSSYDIFLTIISPVR